MKHILVAFFIVCGASAFAQFSKGDKAVSGKLFIEIKQAPVHSNRNSSRRTDIGFHPEFGIFVNKNLAVGGALGYSYGRETISDIVGYKHSFHRLSMGLYGNRYFQIAEKFFFSLLGKAEYHYTKRFWKSANHDTQGSGKRVEANLSPNLIFFPAPNWALTANLGGVEYSYIMEPAASKSYEFNVRLGKKFSLGLSYYFRK